MMRPGAEGDGVGVCEGVGVWVIGVAVGVSTDVCEDVGVWVIGIGVGVSVGGRAGMGVSIDACGGVGVWVMGVSTDVSSGTDVAAGTREGVSFDGREATAGAGVGVGDDFRAGVDAAEVTPSVLGTMVTRALGERISGVDVSVGGCSGCSVAWPDVIALMTSPNTTTNPITSKRETLIMSKAFLREFINNHLQTINDRA